MIDPRHHDEIELIGIRLWTRMIGLAMVWMTFAYVYHLLGKAGIRLF